MTATMRLFRCRCGSERTPPILELTTAAGEDANLFCFTCREMRLHKSVLRAIPFVKVKNPELQTV